MEFKAIALDMDGTTLDSNNTISNDLIDLLSTLRKKGVKVFLATGRTKIEVEDVLPKQFEVDGLVTANGMGCFAGNKQIAQYTLDPDLVSEVVAEARNNKVYYEVHPLNTKRIALLADKEYMQAELNLQKSPTLLENEYNSRLDAIENHICWVDELITTNIIKVYFFSMDSHKINQWKKRLDGKMKEKTSQLHHPLYIMWKLSFAIFQRGPGLNCY